MGEKYKDDYKAPSAMAVEVSHEGIICASEIKSNSSINNWSDGGTTNDEIYL